MSSVSVVMPVFNAGAFLPKTVASVLGQTWADFEFIIIDDGSTDGSGARLRALAESDRRIRLVSRPNRGFVASLTEALGMAQAPLIARMDADDIARPDRLAKQVAFMQAHPEVVVLGGAYDLIDARGRRLRTMHQPTDHATLLRHCLAGTTPLCHPLTMIRRDALDRVGGYDPATFPAEDLDLWLRLAAVGRLACLPDVLLSYRLHAGSISETKQAKQIEALRAVCTRAAERLNQPVQFAADAGWRAGGAESAYEQLLKYGWWAFNSGERSTARHYGLRAILQHPFGSRGWRLFACASLKPPPAPARPEAGLAHA
ncbi:MAG: glycosyltransferase family 2 protein [Tepidisphaeraceae bacterium]